MSHNRIKAKKTSDTESSSSESDSSDSESSTEFTNATTKSKKTIFDKNITYKDEQSDLFKKIKKLLNITDNKQYFTSFELNEVSDVFKNKYIPKIQAFYPSSIWTYGKDSKNYSMCILRKLFKKNGLQLVKKDAYKKF